MQGDLEALPLRSGSLASAWASNTYVHVARSAMPMALGDLHRTLRVGGQIELRLFGGDRELDAFSDDAFPGRRFSLWDEGMLRDVLIGAGFADVSVDPVSSPRGDVELAVSARRARTRGRHSRPGDETARLRAQPERVRR